MMPRNFYIKTSLEILVICFELYFAVPFAIGAYPQLGKVSVDEVEEEFKHLKNSKGDPIKEFIFNKGL